MTRKSTFSELKWD